MTRKTDSSIPTVSYAEKLSEYDQFLKAREGDLRMQAPGMVIAKAALDNIIAGNKPTVVRQRVESKVLAFSVNVEEHFETTVATKLKTGGRTKIMKLGRIHVDIEELPPLKGSVTPRILAKVGPCDLAGVGGRRKRQEIIADVVNQALAKKFGQDTPHNFGNVNISACVRVRGRAQMMRGFLSRNSEGSHMNAYVKTDGEANLTHWEPRKGPQSFFNDTICGLVTSVATSLFEKGIRDGVVSSSNDRNDPTNATRTILKSPELKIMFKTLLKSVRDGVVTLFDNVKKLVDKQHQMKRELQAKADRTDSEHFESGDTRSGPKQS